MSAPAPRLAQAFTIACAVSSLRQRGAGIDVGDHVHAPTGRGRGYRARQCVSADREGSARDNL